MKQTYKRNKYYFNEVYVRQAIAVMLFGIFMFTIGLGTGLMFGTTKEEPIKSVSMDKIEIVEAEKPTIEPMKLEPEKTKPQPQIISANFDILTPSGYTSEELASALSTENHKGLLPYIDTFLEAENKYGVNAFYLMCKMGYESGWGRYHSGKNNIAGWTNGKGGYKDFNSVDDCILYVAERLSTSYKDAVGSRIDKVCERYCPVPGYLQELLKIMKERQNVILFSM